MSEENEGNWKMDLDAAKSNWIHVYPVNDLVEHNTESHECICNPVIDYDGCIVIHASLDRREVYEQQGE